ncbi:RhoGAP-domain-containing protein [Dendrothele bispora CBS 962.96]|uniref:RhoGAP-domain-containing protein n=1 Tax=Dendrothele bispora (strain CBS 962.96) TaxID=1314807 RepID=A0A4S8MSZ4_DENBC|nr:RhoGAP-domain-containing protein [Dendrothele bispora CBS 962.96]
MTDQPVSSRSSLEQPSTSTGPLPSFDIHLRFLTDSYLSFFTERKRIEEVYVESLLKLHKKIRSIDAFLDDRTDLSTARSAWSEVRENVEREAQTRQAFLSTLNIDVVTPLATLKDTQERTRKRIKEDLKESGNAYNEYAEVALPRLKSRYLKKYAEVEEQKRAAAAPTSPAQSPTSPDYQGITNSRSPPNSNTRPVVTSPQPLRALDRRPSGSAPGGRNRSPSATTTAFSDLAQHGKKQLNQLRGFLEKSGTVKENFGGARETHALRTVRAKRELEEANKEYRKGVHWLETLRLRRVKTLESGYNSLLLFVEECSTVVKLALEKYTDNMTATTTTQTQLSSHAHALVSKISPEKDRSKLSGYISRSLASATPDPVLYENCHIGECCDLIFGFSLLDYATTKGLPDGEVPKVVKCCIDEIDKRGLEAEGIYRVSGRHAIVQSLQLEIEKDEEAFEFRPKEDIYAVASLLKLYLRELPEPVFKFSLQERIQHTEDFADHQSNNFLLLRGKMRRLPPVHQATLKYLVEHLARVAAHSEKNKMDPKNLAIVFGAVIFGEDQLPQGGDLLSVQTWKDSLMEDLIIHAHVLFSDDQNLHPLPPPPPGESAPHYPYGSRTTKVANIPSPINVSNSPSHSEDFTPRLPPRPANSIHPSARGPSSPTKERIELPPPLPQRPRGRQGNTTPPSPSVVSSVLETDDSLSYVDSEDLGHSAPTSPSVAPPSVGEDPSDSHQPSPRSKTGKAELQA